MNVEKNNKNAFKEDLINIKNGIKDKICSKDKKVIIDTIKKILVILLVAIIIKIPFNFIEILVLDMLNNMNLTVLLQNIIGFIFNIIYIFLALFYVYNRLKKNYANK